MIINAILFIFFEPAIVVSRYMTSGLFKTIKNLVFKKKPELEKKSEFKKKPLSFEKNLSFKKKAEF